MFVVAGRVLGIFTISYSSPPTQSPPSRQIHLVPNNSQALGSCKMMKRKHTSPKKSNPSKKTKKTKKNTKTQCVDNPVEVVEIQPCDQNESFTGIVAEERPWKNLELILSLQSNELGDKE